VVAAGRGDPEQRGQGLILAERREILAAVPAARPQRDQALDELRGRQAPLPLLDRNLRIDHRGDPQLPEQLDHERDPRAAGNQRWVNGVIDLERQPWRRVGHQHPPRVVCTQWVKTSKPDASGADRLRRGLPRIPFDRSTS
jgi:hypothetical protein